MIAPIAATPEYERSVHTFIEQTGGNGTAQTLISRPPRHDDSDLGPSLFRSFVDQAVLTSLTLPGLYVGRSELRHIDFSASDLRLAAFNWSTVSDCRFERADLRGADLRRCRFVRCSFAAADLREADLRHSSFDNCVFTDAQLAGARFSSLPLLRLVGVRPSLGLARDQAAVVHWSSDRDEPGGG